MCVTMPKGGSQAPLVAGPGPDQHDDNDDVIMTKLSMGACTLKA